MAPPTCNEPVAEPYLPGEWKKGPESGGGGAHKGGVKRGGGEGGAHKGGVKRGGGVEMIKNVNNFWSAAFIFFAQRGRERERERGAGGGGGGWWWSYSRSPSHHPLLRTNAVFYWSC